MVSDRAQKGLNIPSLSSIQNNLYTEDPYHKNNKEVFIIKKNFFILKY